MKKIIDLSQPIYQGMPVYPGDPAVKISDIAKKKYIISKISFGNHTGTHIDAPSHMISGGKTLNDFPLEYFSGKAVKYTKKLPIIINKNHEYQVILIEKISLDEQKIEQITAAGFHLLGFEANSGLTISLIKKLLKHDILLVGKLINLKKVPKTSYFSALPLSFQNANGSPVRAVSFINL